MPLSHLAKYKKNENRRNSGAIRQVFHKTNNTGKFMLTVSSFVQNTCIEKFVLLSS